MAGPVPVELSINNQYYSINNVQFVYQRTCRSVFFRPYRLHVVRLATANVTAVFPVTGPQRGNTTVTVFGHDFVPDVEFLKCRFAGSAPVYTTWITSSELRCVSPPYPPGVVSLEITNNNQDYTSDGVLYTYQRTCTLHLQSFLTVPPFCRSVCLSVATTTVTQLMPNLGPLLGGTLVTVYGTNFIHYGTLPRCQFGTLPATVATFVTGTSVLCVAPPVTMASLPLEVANNGQDFSRSAVPFFFKSTFCSHCKQKPKKTMRNEL